MADNRQLEVRRPLLALAKLILVLAIVGCMGWLLLTVFQAVREATRRIQNSEVKNSSQSLVPNVRKESGDPILLFHSTTKFVDFKWTMRT
jgi:cytoskeletal protein RodZ